MKKSETLEFFKSAAAVSKAAGVTRPGFYRWGDLVPLDRACKLEEASHGHLRVDWPAYGLEPRLRKGERTKRQKRANRPG